VATGFHPFLLFVAAFFRPWSANAYRNE